MKPRNGLVTSVRIVKWRDADTPIVEVKRQFPVRLCDTEHNLSFNAPELSTAAGKKAKKFVEELVGDKEVTLFIPSKDGMLLTDINSFDRIVGEIWIDDQKLTDILDNNGYGEYKKYK